MDRKQFQQKFGIVGESPAMTQVVGQVMQVAPTTITILLQGESGVGKDVVARAIHGLSRRKDRNLVIVNCGAIPEGIIESELFGHEKGSFTGAHETRHGYFEKADGGTIFLDEIGDTPKSVQVKLLRILENGEYFRVGSAEVRKTDTRIIAATNRDLWKDVQAGRFREDLYYRLNTVMIRIPALRERPEDILPMFRKFVLDASAKYDSVFQGFSDDARQLLVSYRWPGNIRELKNVAEQLVVLEKSQFITAETLRQYLKGRQHDGAMDHLPVLHGHGYESEAGSNGRESDLLFRALVDIRAEIGDLKKMLGGFLYSQMSRATPLDPGRILPMPDRDIPLGVRERPDLEIRVPEPATPDPLHEQSDAIPSLEEAERILIERSLRKYEGNRRKAAEALGISERTLYRKIDQYDLGQ